jgi:hypothetical protein
VARLRAIPGALEELSAEGEKAGGHSEKERARERKTPTATRKKKEREKEKG